MALNHSLYKVFLLQLILTCVVKGIMVNSSKQLNEVLKGIDKMAAEVSIELDSTVDYTLSVGAIYTVWNRTVTISTNNDMIADIICERRGHLSIETSGLVFIDSVVTFDHLRFVQCGRNVFNTLPESIGTTLMNIKVRSVALTLINTKVQMTSTYIEHSHGFALLGYNLINSSFFERVRVRNTYRMNRKESNEVDIGNGMLIYFDDYHTNQEAVVVLNKCEFSNNTNVYKGHGINCMHEEFVKGHDKVRHHFAAALSIFYTQKLYIARVSINDGVFSQNSGVYAGAILMVNLKDTSAATKVKGGVFLRNSLSSCHGPDMQYFHLGGNITKQTPLLALEDTIFMGGNSGVKHTAALGSVTIELYTPIPSKLTHFNFLNVTFSDQNTVQIEGVCLQMILFRNSNRKVANVKALLLNMTVIDNHKAYNRNTPKSLLYFENIKKVEFGGRGLFMNNLGSVISVREGKLYVGGNMKFISNSADNGPAILGHANVQLFLKRKLKARFINNTAYYSGGAIYVRSNSYNNCAVQTKGINRGLYFSGNTAQTAGNDIFISPISKCKKHGTYSDSWLENYTNYFNLRTERCHDNRLLRLSTVPSAIVIRFKDYDKLQEILTYPGQIIHFKIAAKDRDHRNVFSFISIQVFTKKGDDPTGYQPGKVWLQQSGGDRALEQPSKTIIDISVHTNNSGMVHGTMVFSIPEFFSKAYYVTIKPCPIGFVVDKNTGTCVCSHLVSTMRETNCYINTRNIHSSTSYRAWLGIMDNNTLGLSLSCPLTFCNRVRHKYTEISDEGQVTVTDNNITKPLCKGHRVGTLCGECNHSANHSVVFGSYHCQECSNLWLLTIILYAVSGPLQLYFIYRLGMTVTSGTINGAIFYIQATNVGVLEYLSEAHVKQVEIKRANKVVNAVFELLNSNLPFRLCFYNGMTQLSKTGFGLLFPIYGVVVVLVIIVISRYSIRVSNRTAHLSVQVLITSVHLSFSKLLASLLEVFTAAKVETETESFHVWYWDGSLEYMGHAHYPLVVVTVVTVLLLLIPYITILIIGKPLMRASKRANAYLRPVIEAVYAPYRPGKHHWFVLRLILLLLLYMNYVVFRTNSKNGLIIISSLLLLVFTVLQAFTRPFINTYLNALDLWLMLNYTIVHGMVWTEPSFLTALTIIILIFLALGTFVLILLYHVAMATNRLKRIKDKLSVVTNRLRRNPVIRFVIENNSLQTHKNTTLDMKSTDLYYGSCDQYREPLLGMEHSHD